jgi:hypothetical protein
MKALLALFLIGAAYAAFPPGTGSVSVPITVTHRALTLNVTPAQPTIPSSDGTSGNVTALQGVWSDGSAFTGAYIFVSPNYDADTYSVSGSNLVLASNGRGVGNAGGTTEHVTMEAVQLDPTADLVMSSAPNGAPLATSNGVWSWGPIVGSRTLGSICNTSDYVVYLNGAFQGCAILMEVAHGGQLYVKNTGAVWFVWNGSGFATSAAP